MKIKAVILLTISLITLSCTRLSYKTSELRVFSEKYSKMEKAECVINFPLFTERAAVVFLNSKGYNKNQSYIIGRFYLKSWNILNKLILITDSNKYELDMAKSTKDEGLYLDPIEELEIYFELDKKIIEDIISTNSLKSNFYCDKEIKEFQYNMDQLRIVKEWAKHIIVANQ